MNTIIDTAKNSMINAEFNYIQSIVSENDSKHFADRLERAKRVFKKAKMRIQKQETKNQIETMDYRKLYR